VVQIVMSALVARQRVGVDDHRFVQPAWPARRRSDRYEQGFWEARDIDAYTRTTARATCPPPAWSAPRWANGADPPPARMSTAKAPASACKSAMDSAVAAETDRLSGRLGFLATVGSVAPFVGLFGTVWGIMDSFFNIGAQANSSLAVVAPGISEALFATAIGLSRPSLR
jgi:biopolymer transport protein TolQ